MFQVSPRQKKNKRMLAGTFSQLSSFLPTFTFTLCFLNSFDIKVPVVCASMRREELLLLYHQGFYPISKCGINATLCKFCIFKLKIKKLHCWIESEKILLNDDTSLPAKSKIPIQKSEQSDFVGTFLKRCFCVWLSLADLWSFTHLQRRNGIFHSSITLN